MNVLHSVLTGGWGGLEKYPVETYEELVKNNNKVYILTLKNTNLEKKCRELRIPVETIDRFKRFDLKIQKTMRDNVIRNKIDIVHCHRSGEIYNWFFALRSLKSVKLYISFHIGVSNKNDLIHKIFYKRPAGIIATASEWYKKMQKKLPVDNDKIHILNYGVDLNKFDYKKIRTSFRKEVGIKEDDLIITVVGNVSPAKGVEEFLRAAEKLNRKYKNVYFVWIGEDKFSLIPNYINKIKKRLKGTELEKRLIFTGYRTDIPAILKDSNVFTLPSHGEAFGIVYIEAMAMGLPVIGCDSGGVPDIIENNKNGFLVKPEDPDDLAAAIEKYIKSKELRIKHGKYSLKSVNKFSMDRHVTKLLQIYKTDFS